MAKIVGLTLSVAHERLNHLMEYEYAYPLRFAGLLHATDPGRVEERKPGVFCRAD